MIINKIKINNITFVIQLFKTIDNKDIIICDYPSRKFN
jgi:hypothetical protein